MERGGNTYMPQPAVLQELQDVPLIGVVGITGAGKTTLMQHACGVVPELYFVISDTSRDPRPGETDGQDYYFRSHDYMEQRIATKSYATVAPSTTGDVYATDPGEYLRGRRPMMAVLASVMPDFAQTFPAMQSIAVLPPDFATWRERLGTRDMSSEQYARRVDEARQSLHFVLSQPDILCVVNDNLKESTATFIEILQGERRPSRIEVDRRRAKNIANNILQALS